MVKRLITPAVCLFLLTALLTVIWLPAQAQTQSQQLTVEPDRTRLYEGEVLTLTVKGSMEIDINLGNLFDFDMSNLPKPDIEKVEPDFEILAQNQQYSIRTVNNQMVNATLMNIADNRTSCFTGFLYIYCFMEISAN